MPSLNIRGLEEVLVRQVKAEAAKNGMAMREWVKWVLEAQFNGRARVDAQAVPGVGREKRGKIDAGASMGGLRTDDGVGTEAVGDAGGIVGRVDGLGLRECPSCGGRLLENRKLRKRICMDEQCGYQEPIR